MEKHLKVLCINGSAKKDGNTSDLINIVSKELRKENITTEIIHVGNGSIRGCTSCLKCWENQNQHCVIKSDPLNSILDKMLTAEGIILASPVYCADVSSHMKAFMERSSLVSFANNDMLQRKVGAGIIAVRRAGGMTAFAALNNYFLIAQMVVVGSSYWNIGFGNETGEVLQDDEGIQTMINLAKNMSWLLKCLDIAKGKVKEPETKTDTFTNFIK